MVAVVSQQPSPLHSRLGQLAAVHSAHEPYVRDSREIIIIVVVVVMFGGERMLRPC